MKYISLLLLLPSLATAGTITIMPVVTASVPDTIAVDSITVGPVPDGSASPITWSHLIAGSNRFIAVGCSTAFDVGTVAATVGGNNMTLSTGTTRGDYQTKIFTYIAPPTGSQNISVSWTSGGTNSRMLCGAISYTGVSQSSPVDVSTGSYAGGGSITATVTTVTENDALFGVVNDNGSSSQIGVPTAGQNVAKFLPGSSNGFALYISSRSASAAGSYNDSWTSFGGPTQESYIGIKRGP